MEKLSVREARQAEAIGRQATLSGWIRTRRDSKGGFSFLEVNDGSCLANIQIVADGDLPNYQTEIKRLSAGCSVTVCGTIKPSGGKGQAPEIHAKSVQVHGWADPKEFPLQKKRHSFEKLREWAHLRPRTNTFGAVARVRSQLCQSIHSFFHERNFLYVHTPIITASDCEGAGEMFRVTTLDPANTPRTSAGKVDTTHDFFGRPTYLTVSGQLEGEIYATALGKVYTFGPTFRAENSNTSRHLAEFWMVEPEMAFCTLQENMDLAEQFLKHLCSETLSKSEEDLQFFNDRINDQLLQRLTEVSASERFERISYTEAVALLEKSGESFDYPITWGANLQAEHERYLTEKVLRRPVIVYDYPASIKPFYMKLNDDERTVAAMDVLLPGVGEIIGGSQREDRLDVIEAKMQDQGLRPEDYWWYLDLRRFGTVPHAGFGLGLERMVQFVTGMANIRDVIPFPRTPGNAEF